MSSGVTSLKENFATLRVNEFELELASAGTVDGFLATSVGSSSGTIVSKSTETGAQLLESLEVELDGYESQLKELNSYSEKLTIE